MSQNCNVCAATPATLQCSNCNQRFYCSEKHQNTDLKHHKSTCFPLKIDKNEAFGRYLVATRDIQPGEVIISKSPLLLGPKIASYPMCLGCNKQIESSHHLCKCKWPLCSEECEKSPSHIEECEIFQKAKFTPPVQNMHEKQSGYCIILPLRALILKKTNPKQFESLLDCQSHLDKHKQTKLYQILKLNLVPLFTSVFKLDTSEEEILKICSIFDTNCFDVRDSRGEVNARGLYPMISLLPHNCKHNAKHVFNEDFQISVIATLGIQKGEAISITYTQTLWDTMARREHLRRAKNFDCSCERCKDPTEFGTYCSSVLCKSCDGGLVVSTDPLDDESDWECENCGTLYDAEEISLLNAMLKAELDRLDKSSAENLEHLLDKYEKVVHSTNRFCLEIKYALTQFYGIRECRGYFDNGLVVNRKIELCQELLTIAEVLEPGYSRFRGVLLFDLQNALFAKYNGEFGSGLINKEKYKEQLDSIAKCLQEASAILKCEPELHRLVEKSEENVQNEYKTIAQGNLED